MLEIFVDLPELVRFKLFAFSFNTHNIIIAMANKRDWDEGETFQLIELYEENPCLWEIKNNDYQKKDKREVALSAISDEVNISIIIGPISWPTSR